MLHIIIFFISFDYNFYIRYCNIINSIHLFLLHVVLGGFSCIIIFIWIAVSTIVREIIKCSLRVVVYINSKLLLVNTHQMYIRSIHCTIINYNSNETTSVKAIRRASFIWGFLALK